MFKATAKLFITLLLSTLLITSNALSFHKDGKYVDEINADEGVKKKDVKSAYCTSQVETKEIILEDFTLEKEVIVDNEKESETKSSSEAKTPQETRDEWDKKKEQEKKENETIIVTNWIKKKLFIFESYHSSKEEKAPAVLNISILKDMKKIDSDTSIEELLSYYCLQPATAEARKFKFSKNSDIAKLYEQIAKINGYIDDENGKFYYIDENGKGDRNSSIQGEIFDAAKINIDVGVPLIYSEAHFIHVERERLKKEKIKAEEDAERKAEAAARAEEEKKWIAENKPPLLKKIDAKISKYDEQIKKINSDYDKLKISHENFQKYFNEKLLEVEDFLDLVDVGQKQIKDIAIELKKAKREYLDSKILDDFKSKFKSTNKVEGKNYENYNKLVKLRNAIVESKKKKHFNEGRTTSKGTKIDGFYTQWENRTTEELNDEQQGNIGALNDEIAKAKQNIINNIDSLKTEIERLEEELSNEFPIMEVVIGFLIFLAVIGFGVYVYLQNKKIKEIRDDADKKVGYLKSDLEGKFRDTSEQIKKAGRRGQQQTSETQAPVVEKPQTQEEIIANKYDELVFDYNEALEDFSKVAGFKQKWHGLALSKKPRQEGTKTVLINSSRAFEKAEIWCVTFSEKYFAFPGSTVKSNMATYMNMDFMKAGQDFKGVFSISEGSSYSTEAAVLRRGGAGFVVERVGKLVFPN